MICSVYRNDQIQELGRSGKQAVIWYLEDDIQEGVLGLAQSVRPKDDIIKFDTGLPNYLKSTLSNDLKEKVTKKLSGIEGGCQFSILCEGFENGRNMEIKS